MNLKLSESTFSFTAERVYCAGYAGRDQAEVRAHIEELAKIGVPAPPQTPTVYPVSKRLLTSENEIFVQNHMTSGEVEFVLFLQDDDIFISVGSDHTDRELEKQDIARAKQICEKPHSLTVWHYRDVAAHWDALILRSWIADEKGRRPYQEGSVSALLPVPDLLGAIRRAAAPPPRGAVVYSGTIPAASGLAFARHWELELEDPVRRRKISHRYKVTVLEDEIKK